MTSLSATALSSISKCLKTLYGQVYAIIGIINLSVKFFHQCGLDRHPHLSMVFFIVI